MNAILLSFLLMSNWDGACLAGWAGETATIIVECAANAVLEVDGVRIEAYGPHRELRSPPLEAGKRYEYTITIDGEAQVVYFHAGETCRVSSAVNHGLSEEWLKDRRDAREIGETIWHNGELVHGMTDVTADGPEDDGDKPWITFIGSSDERRRMVDDWNQHPALAAYRSGFRRQAYPPDHWALTSVGFDPQANVVVQSADGRELHRQRDYDGAESLAGVLEQVSGLRKPRPDFDPTKWIDLRSYFSWRAMLSRIPSGTWAAVVGLILLVLFKKRG